MVWCIFRVGGKKQAALLGLLAGAVVSGYALGEKTLVLGAASGWGQVERLIRVTEVPLIRTNPVLALLPLRSGQADPGSAAGEADEPDMLISFDEGKQGLFADRTGNYRLLAGPSLSTAGARWARAGTGAAIFSGAVSPLPVSAASGAGLTVLPLSRTALLSGVEPVRDFSIEFWLYPFNAASGEQVIAWTSIRQGPGEGPVYQRFRAEIVRSRLQWSFDGLFTAPGGRGSRSLTLSPQSSLVPQTWTHHLIRFDGDTGLLEYLVNGELEGTRYATSTGREGGEVYSPVLGRNGELVLGGHYTGIMDEFRTSRRWVEGPALGRYPREGGRIETRPLDLGKDHTDILRVDALGGKFSLGESRGRIQNHYAGEGDLRFAGQGDLEFFIRAADNPYGWTDDDAEWLPILPGRELPGALRGRFVQLAAVFYPSGDGETSPYLDEIRIRYKPREPVLPPAALTAVARDGAVDLSWRMSQDPELGGYLVYYGNSPGEYFGEDAILGPSPIDVGKRNSVRIDGLRNGTLYFFCVAAYDRRDAELGEYSRELSARPLRVAALRMVE